MFTLADSPNQWDDTFQSENIVADDLRRASARMLDSGSRMEPAATRLFGRQFLF